VFATHTRATPRGRVENAMTISGGTTGHILPLGGKQHNNAFFVGPNDPLLPQHGPGEGSHRLSDNVRSAATSPSPTRAGPSSSVQQRQRTGARPAAHAAGLTQPVSRSGDRPSTGPSAPASRQPGPRPRLRQSAVHHDEQQNRSNVGPRVGSVTGIIGNSWLKLNYTLGAGLTPATSAWEDAPSRPPTLQTG